MNVGIKKPRGPGETAGRLAEGPTMRTNVLYHGTSWSARGKSMRRKLQASRKDAGITQQAMADKIGITLRYYQQIEAGDRTGDFSVWDALEDITGIHQRILREIDHGPKDSQ